MEKDSGFSLGAYSGWDLLQTLDEVRNKINENSTDCGVDISTFEEMLEAHILAFSEEYGDFDHDKLGEPRVLMMPGKGGIKYLFAFSYKCEVEMILLKSLIVARDEETRHQERIECGY